MIVETTTQRHTWFLLVSVPVKWVDEMSILELFSVDNVRFHMIIESYIRDKQIMAKRLHMRLTPALHILQYVSIGHICKNKAPACARVKLAYWNKTSQPL